MNRPAITLIVCALLVAPAAAQQNRPGVLRGTVIDNMAHVPVGYAAVRLLRHDSSVAAAGLTDASGWFNLSAPGGMYRLQVDHFGYENLPDTDVTISRGDTLIIAVRVNPHPVVLDEILVSRRSEARRLQPTEQLIHGRLIDDANRSLIPGATIHLLDRNGKSVAKTMTSDDGLFRLITAAPGTYILRAERIGYRTASSGKLNMMLGDTIRLDFFLSTEAVLLDPILVNASARPLLDRYELRGMDGFFQRMKDWNNRGYFFTRKQIDDYERRGYTTMRIIDTLLLRSPHACYNGLVVWWNGLPFTIPEPQPPRTWDDEINSIFSPASLEGVEVYVAPRIPASLMSGAARFPCMVLVFWSRREPKR